MEIWCAKTNVVHHDNRLVKVLRDPQMIRGFLYEEPVEEIPALTHCGEALCCRGHALPFHSHAGFEFLYLSRGICHWEVGNSAFRQTMGDLFIAHPGEPHRTGSKLNSENRHLWMGLRLEKIGPDGTRLAEELRRSQVRLLLGCHDAEPLLSAVISQIMTLRPHRAEVVAALLHALVPLISQRLALSRSRSQETTYPALPYSSAVQKTIAYMQKNLDRRISLHDLATVATIRHAPQLCTLFHKEVGTTPARRHTQMRLEAAREALRQPSGTITTVALQFGFSSSQHFSTQFRRAFGLSPRLWQLGPNLTQKNGRSKRRN
jgi:AraC-like DNA-binding protein